MLKLGIIGMNEGNGHPFSYSAMFNGFDPVALKKRCPFELIKKYLPEEHQNRNLIGDADVTHIWTQDISLSEDIAAVAKIPNIVTNYEDMIGKVDGIILARDDPWNHLEMARPFLAAQVPIFIDKQLTASKEDLDLLLELSGIDYKLMACSAMRYTRDVKVAKSRENLANVKSIHGMSRVSWMRYGHHLLEGIVAIWGVDVNWVRSLSSDKNHDIVQIEYESGLNVILEFITDISLPIKFTCFSETGPPFEVHFQDFYYSFREMMQEFTNMLTTNVVPIPYSEIVSIAKIIIAGDLSKKDGGKPYSPKSLKPV